MKDKRTTINSPKNGNHGREAVQVLCPYCSGTAFTWFYLMSPACPCSQSIPHLQCTGCGMLYCADIPEKNIVNMLSKT